MKKLITIFAMLFAGFAQAGNLKDITISIQPNYHCSSMGCDRTSHIRVVMRGSTPVKVSKIVLNGQCEIQENPYGYVGAWENFSMGKSIPIPEVSGCGQTIKVEVFTSGGKYSFMLPS